MSTATAATQGNAAPTDETKAAVIDMGEQLAHADIGNPLASLTCSEVESITRVLRAFDQHDSAETITYLHAAADLDPDDTHHDLYLERYATSRGHAFYSHAPTVPAPDRTPGPPDPTTGVTL